MSNRKQRVDEDGRLFCPLTNTRVALERCLLCPRQVDFDVDGRRPFIVCRAPDERIAPVKTDAPVISTETT